MSVLMKVERTPGTDAPDYLFFCPGCGCGHGVWTTHPNGITGATWQFNGDMAKPTITPSIRIEHVEWHPPVTPDNLDKWRKEPWTQTQKTVTCHVVVTDGKLNFCGDCTHELAGKTVEMVDMEAPPPGMNY